MASGVQMAPTRPLRERVAGSLQTPERGKCGARERHRRTTVLVQTRRARTLRLRASMQRGNRSRRPVIRVAPARTPAAARRNHRGCARRRGGTLQSPARSPRATAATPTSPVRRGIGRTHRSTPRGSRFTTRHDVVSAGSAAAVSRQARAIPSLICQTTVARCKTRVIAASPGSSAPSREQAEHGAGEARQSTRSFLRTATARRHRRAVAKAASPSITTATTRSARHAIATTSRQSFTRHDDPRATHAAWRTPCRIAGAACPQ